jgi:uncharacterized membrane protein
MSLVASIRPHGFDIPLLVHVLGAMVLVGATATAATLELASLRAHDAARLRRLGFRVVVLVSVPAYVALQGGAAWIHEKEFPKGSSDPTWIGIGHVSADVGGLVLLVALGLAGYADRRGRPGLARAAGVLAAVALAGWLVAVWAMGAKPQ